MYLCYLHVLVLLAKHDQWASRPLCRPCRLTLQLFCCARSPHCHCSSVMLALLPPSTGGQPHTLLTRHADEKGHEGRAMHISHPPTCQRRVVEGAQQNWGSTRAALRPGTHPSEGRQSVGLEGLCKRGRGIVAGAKGCVCAVVKSSAFSVLGARWAMLGFGCKGAQRQLVGDPFDAGCIPYGMAAKCRSVQTKRQHGARPLFVTAQNGRH